MLSVENPGVWSDAEAADLLHPDDAHRIHAALADLGYTLIPEEPLWQPYDGVCDPEIFAPSDATWGSSCRTLDATLRPMQPLNGSDGSAHMAGRGLRATAAKGLAALPHLQSAASRFTPSRMRSGVEFE